MTETLKRLGSRSGVRSPIIDATRLAVSGTLAVPHSYTYKYPRPMVTVDLVVFAFDGSALRSLFIRRKHDPFAGMWAIPGGYLEMDETIQAAALRELKEETGLDAPAVIEEIGTYGDPGRDPRGRTISVAHAGVVRGIPPQVEGSDDAEEASWLDPREVEELAFDHRKIIERALQWLISAMGRDEVVLAFLPEEFTAKEVKNVFREVTGRSAKAARWLATRQESGVIVAGGDGRFSRG